MEYSYSYQIRGQECSFRTYCQSTSQALSTSYGTGNFIAVFSTACHWSPDPQGPRYILMMQIESILPRALLKYLIKTRYVLFIL
jgi:hypothetical protein